MKRLHLEKVLNAPRYRKKLDIDNQQSVDGPLFRPQSKTETVLHLKTKDTFEIDRMEKNFFLPCFAE